MIDKGLIDFIYNTGILKSGDALMKFVGDVYEDRESIKVVLGYLKDEYARSDMFEQHVDDIFNDLIDGNIKQAVKKLENL